MALLPALRLQAKYFSGADFAYGPFLLPVAGGPQDVWDNRLDDAAEILSVGDWTGNFPYVLCCFYDGAVIDPDPSLTLLKFEFFNGRR